MHSVSKEVRTREKSVHVLINWVSYGLRQCMAKRPKWWLAKSNGGMFNKRSCGFISAIRTTTPPTKTKTKQATPNLCVSTKDTFGNLMARIFPQGGIYTSLDRVWLQTMDDKEIRQNFLSTLTTLRLVGRMPRLVVTTGNTFPKGSSPEAGQPTSRMFARPTGKPPTGLLLKSD